MSPLLREHKTVAHVQDTGAWIAYRRGDFKKARDLLMGVEDEIKETPVITYHMGMILLELGEEKRAKEYLQMALRDEQDFVGRKEAEKTLLVLR